MAGPFLGRSEFGVPSRVLVGDLGEVVFLDPFEIRNVERVLKIELRIRRTFFQIENFVKSVGKKGVQNGNQSVNGAIIQ